jgi:hypothetical protein
MLQKPESSSEPVEPDYDDLPRGDSNPMWEVAIAILGLLVALGAIVAFG